MTEATQVAAIAAGLTKEQRAVLRLLRPGQECRAVCFYSDVANRLCVATTKRGPLLARYSMPQKRGMIYYSLPLGLAVRAHLMQERP